MKDISNILKSLSDETRLRILLLLLENGRLCVCDLMAVLKLPQSTISRHLARLKNAGIVTDERQGVWMYYQIPEAAGIKHDLLHVVQNHCSITPQANEDRKRFQSYIKTKKAASCSKEAAK